MAAVGWPDRALRRHGSVPQHQPFDPAPAGAASLCLLGYVDPRAAITSASILMDVPDLGQQCGVRDLPSAHRAPSPSIIAGRRDLEHVAHHPYRIDVLMVLDEQKLKFVFRQRSRSTL